MTQSIDVYSFVDEEYESRNDNNHRLYMRHSLAKNTINKKTNKEKVNKIEVEMNEKHFSAVKTFNYNQFMNQYKNVVKGYYPFLPIKQIIQKTRQMWNRFKQTKRSPNHSIPKSAKKVPKSSLKSKSTQKEIKKKVSFDFTANQLLVKCPESSYKSSKKSMRNSVSKYFKPLDINFETPKRDHNSRAQVLEETIPLVSPKRALKSKDLSINKRSDRVIETQSTNASVSAKRALFQSPEDLKMSFDSPKRFYNSKAKARVSVSNKSDRILTNTSLNTMISSKRALFKSPKSDESLGLVSKENKSIDLIKRSKASVPEELYTKIALKMTNNDTLCDLFDTDV